MIIVGFVMHKNVSTSEPFDRDIVPILDSSKYLAVYIHKVALAACPSLVYSKQWHQSSSQWRRVQCPTDDIPIHRPYN